jgi:glycosyltransferase involved in cell wall biosynthesis
LAIVGDGPLLGSLKEIAASFAIGDRVHFLGIRHDVPAVMAACDVFVLSSATEGFGLVVAEAMACGRLVVATDCGGVHEVVGESGFLVPPCDSVALGTALGKALQMPDELRDQLGRAARDRVIDYFSLTATANRYLAAYQGKAEDFS